MQFDFDGADVKDVVKVILHDILHANYTISPKVAGQVTLSTGAPLQDPDLLTVLETVLRMNGAGLAQINGTYVVAPVDELPASAQVVPLGGSSPPALPSGAGITIVPLRFLAATSAAQFVQPLLRRPEDIRIDPSRNLILFSGSTIERQNVIDTLTAIDVDWLAGKSIGIFPLQHATPEALAPELQSLFARPGAAPQGQGEFQPVQFMPISRLNAILAVEVAAADPRGPAVGLPSGPGRRRRPPVLCLRAQALARGGHGEAAQRLVRRRADDQRRRCRSERTLALLRRRRAHTRRQCRADVAGRHAGRLVRHGLGSFGAGALSGPMQGVKIVANKFNNTLLIRATPQAYEMIEARSPARHGTAAGADRGHDRRGDAQQCAEYGIQYYLHQGNFRAGFDTTANGGLSGSVTPNDLSPLANVPGFNFIFSGGNADVTIDALAQITHVRVLSSPSVVVQDNSEAVLTVGDEVPITTRTAVSVDDPSAPVVNNIEYRNTGVILQVKPRINSDQVVALQIGQEVSRVVNTAQLATNSPTPTIQQRKITSTVDVASGQTVVLGGLIQDSEQRSNGKVPILGDVPILGPLLGSNTNNSDDRTELIVFITPRVIRDSQDARDISEELRARMRALGSQGFLPAPGTMPPAATVPATPHGPTPLLPPPVTVRPVTPLPPSSQLLRPLAPVAMAVPVARPTPPPCALCGGPSSVVASLEPAALRGMHPRPRPIAFRVLAIGPPPARPELPWGPVEAALRPALVAVM